MDIRSSKIVPYVSGRKNETTKFGGAVSFQFFGRNRANIACGYSVLNPDHGDPTKARGRLSACPWAFAIVLSLTTRGWRFRSSGGEPHGVDAAGVNDFPRPTTTFFSDDQALACVQWVFEKARASGAPDAATQEAALAASQFPGTDF